MTVVQNYVSSVPFNFSLTPFIINGVSLCVRNHDYDESKIVRNAPMLHGHSGDHVVFTR